MSRRGTGHLLQGGSRQLSVPHTYHLLTSITSIKISSLQLPCTIATYDICCMCFIGFLILSIMVDSQCPELLMLAIEQCFQAKLSKHSVIYLKWLLHNPAMSFATTHPEPMLPNRFEPHLFIETLASSIILPDSQLYVHSSQLSSLRLCRFY